MDFSGFIINRTLVDVNFNDYITVIQDCVNQISNANTLIAEDIKFLCFSRIDDEIANRMTFEDLSTLGIGILDWFLFHAMREKENLRRFCVWTVIEPDYTYDFTAYPKALFIAYFILLTRAKIDFDSNEPIPKFISQYCGIKLSKDDIKRHLSRNDLSKLSHLWIKNIIFTNMSEALIQRIKTGVAGTRLYTAIKSIKPDKENINENIKNCYDAVLRVAEGGPYWSQHPFFYPESLRGVSILKNLNNLMLEIYTPKTLQSMVASKMIFKVPKYDERYVQYRTWSTNFSDLFIDADKITFRE